MAPKLDPYGYPVLDDQGNPLDDGVDFGGYTNQGTGAGPAPKGPTGLDDPNLPAGTTQQTGSGKGGGSSQVTPAAPPTDPSKTASSSPFDRQKFQNEWMSASGSLDDFLKAHPEYSGVQSYKGSKDVYSLPTGEVLDLVGDSGPGGKNSHNWTGTGFDINGKPDQPAGGSGAGSAGNGLPPAFGSLQDFMAGQGGGAGSASSSSGPKDLSSIYSTLQGLMQSGGGFNQDLVNRRVSNASDTLNRNRQSQLKTNQAMLADRGLMGSGPESSAATSLESRLGDSFNSGVNDIYANESAAADQRLVQALQIAAGMNEADAQNAIAWFKAQSDNSLGQGQLQLGNKNADNNYNLGLGDLSLGNMKAGNDYNLGAGNLQYLYDKLNSDSDQTSLQDLIDLLQQRTANTNTTTQGYR